jgi:chromosome segregation protein
MRLHSIKLSGFKSFVEPTHFQLPGQLVGVVGPNGCGKSNIRCGALGPRRKQGERAARQSMQDDFTTARTGSPPAAPASSSFDNTSPRRRPVEPVRGDRGQASADATARAAITSTASRCAGATSGRFRHRPRPARLRDHRPGTISGGSSSKPEELRLFLEEAAGVSKYKERRRETESRS